MSRYTYGSPGVTAADVMAQAIVARRGLDEATANRLVDVAGKRERPPVRTVADLADARPAIVYYACRLLAEACADVDVDE